MAKKTGTPTIWRKSREIARTFNDLGASDMTEMLGANFTTCIVNLVACVAEVLLTDDYVLMKDRTSPSGPEDPL